MKKRLLALALCLVMATSLLPVTAFALTDDDIIEIKDQGIYCGDTYFTLTSPVLEVKNGLTGEPMQPDDHGRYKLSGGSAAHAGGEGQDFGIAIIRRVQVTGKSFLWLSAFIS